MLTAITELLVRRTRLVLALSIAFVLACAVVGSGAFSALKSAGFADPNSGSVRAEKILADRFTGRANLILLVTPRNGASLQDPTVVGQATAVANTLSATDGVRDVSSYWSTHSPNLASTDSRAGLILANVGGDDATAADTATAVIAQLGRGHPAIDVRAGGQLGVNVDVGNQVGKDLALAEGIAVPITVVLLLLAFGSVVSALLPMSVAIVSVAGTFAELSILAHLTDVSIYAVNLTTALALGLGIDYALLIVSRFREELSRGVGTEDAVRTTVRTAGRTVAFSSATVAAALTALLVFPVYFLRSFAYAGIGCVLLAMLGALVVLPALLLILGPRVDAGRIRRSRSGPAGAAAGIPAAVVVQSASAQSVFWGRLADQVMRRPVQWALPVVALLLLLAAPILHISFASPDDRVLPTSAPSRQVGDALRQDFSTSASAQIYVVLQGRPGADAVRSYAQKLSGFTGVRTVASSVGAYQAGQPISAAGTSSGPASTAPAGPALIAGDVQYLVLVGPSDPASAAAQGIVHRVRDTAAPAGTSALVGGSTADLIDAKGAIAGRLPAALAWIVVTTFLLLFAFTGSVLLPLKALVLNAVGLSAVFGVIVWIFQDGHLSGLLGFTPKPVDTSMPMLLFCIAFGLSMDYEVFLLARIKERRDAGDANAAAVAGGLARTGRIVTTAAGLLSVSFFAFGTGQISFLQLFGIGTGLAILLDATLIRGILVPAFMRLAGDYNWWAPAPLRRLHDRFGLREHPAESWVAPQASLRVMVAPQASLRVMVAPQASLQDPGIPAQVEGESSAPAAASSCNKANA